MSANLIIRCCPNRGVLPAARQQLKNLRGLHAGRSASSTVGVSAATQEDANIKPYDEIPGPKPFPIIGNLWRFLPVVGEFAGKELDDLHRMMYHKYGPLIRLSKVPGRRDMVFTFRPEDMEVTYRNEGPWPIREGLQSLDYYRTVVRKDFYQDGGSVVTENGPKWLESRSKVNQPMMQPRITKRYIPQIDSVAQEFLNKMRAMRDDKDELPPHFINELFKWALESIACVAMDTRLGCLEPNLSPDSEPQKLINAVQIVFEGLFQLEVAPPLWKVYPTPAWKKLAGALDVFLDVSVKYVQAAIDRAERRKAEGQTEEDGEPSVLERLLARTDMKTASIMAQDMMLGGIDTTSYSTATVLYMLSKNQDKQEQLYKEIKHFLPNKDSPVTDENREQMKFLKAVFKECMRLSPLIIGGMRKTVKDVVLSNYRVPEGVNIAMSNVMLRENEDIYPQAKRFLPERWLKNRPTAEDAGSPEDFDAVSHGKPNPFAFLPFGFGPRSCVGKRFAELEMETLVAKVIRNFRVEYNYGEVTMTSRLINMIKDPLTFKLTERNE